MSEGKHTHERDVAGSEKLPHSHPSYWGSAHRDWRIWVALFFMCLAIIIYVASDDLALRFTAQPQQQPGAAKR